MHLRHDIELFHLLFIKSFLTSQDKSLIILKGGCNLRFFLGSLRYSEDIDFDVTTIGRDTLKKRVDKTLKSKALTTSLAAARIRIVAISSAKQTDTVQRWKVMIHARGQDIPTKIEFSRRGISRDGVLFEAVDPQVQVAHRLTPTFMSHYNASYAIQQKIEALAGRPETQARDAFDLDLLFNHISTPTHELPPDLIENAIACAISIDFDQFRGQVVEFLPEDLQSYYSDRKIWDNMQHKLVIKLESLIS